MKLRAASVSVSELAQCSSGQPVNLAVFASAVYSATSAPITFSNSCTIHRLTPRSLWGLRYIDDLVLRDRFDDGTERLYALHDQWHVTAISGAEGTVVERYAYEAFGQSQVQAPDYIERTGSLYDWDVRFGACRFDPETEMYQVSFRYLQPEIGRWVSRDPILENGGTNLFQYLANNPGNAVDILGLAEKRQCHYYVAVGHTGEISNFGENLETTMQRCDAFYPISCQRTRSGGPVWPDEGIKSRSLLARPEDPTIAQELFRKIKGAEQDAEFFCSRPWTCCATIEISVTCLTSREVDWALKYDPEAQRGCGYRNKYTCGGGKWAQTKY